MYDSLTAYEEFLFGITITNTFTTVYDLLSSEDKDKLIPYTRGDINCIDGYVVSFQDVFDVRIAGGSGTEKVEIGERYQSPSYNWIKRLEVKSLSDISASVRIFVGRPRG